MPTKAVNWRKVWNVCFLVQYQKLSFLRALRLLQEAGLTPDEAVERFQSTRKDGYVMSR